jgi:hypothetical protein
MLEVIFSPFPAIQPPLPKYVVSAPFINALGLLRTIESKG